ncbi:MAG: hypothetical protein A3F42_02520 [Gammaproteobacteria bacterium RIFCSPHIGHO2_12_FULL_37_34]|nr:MAG: hypothetical protein A3F42_02520 [Gammaproteobacteria bacterium RIFCSPHIGHO2_12_FULL_37_34]
MKKIIVSLILFLFLPLGWAATTAPLEKLTVLLDWFPNPDHAPLIIAKQQGFFKEQGLEVELLEPNHPGDVFKQITIHEADIGLAYQPQFMEQIDQGLPLIRIGTLIDKPLNCIVVLDGNMKSLTGLKGKHIGLSSNKLSNAILNVMLAKQGLSNKDVVKITQTDHDLSQALLSHQVDAVTDMTRNFEVPQLEKAGYKLAVFFPEEHGIPNYSQLILITHMNNIHDKRFPRFLVALRNAVEYLDMHPREAWQQFAKQYPESNNKVNREAWFATIPYFSEDPANFDNDEWNSFAEFLFKNKLIKKVQPISRYAVVI